MLLETAKHVLYNNTEAGSLTSRCCFHPRSCVLAPRGEQDDKGIQVDTQDLGYETSGRSETEVEREEGSSTGRRERIGDSNSLSVSILPNLAFLSTKKNTLDFPRIVCRLILFQTITDVCS